MNKGLLLSIALVSVLTACGQTDRTHKDVSRDRMGDARDYPADNTGRNVRDRSDQVVTPGNQFENEQDLALTQNIRAIIVRDDSLSTNAKNIKIITRNGVVVLRGVVNNGDEKQALVRIAQQVQGAKHVEDQIDVK